MVSLVLLIKLRKYRYIYMSIISNKPRVLIVDDSNAIRAFFTSALSEFSFDLIAMADPRVALEKLSEIQPDCILSDYEMPEMNGVQFCQAVKSSEKYRSIPFVILSMHDNDKCILECLASGVDDYLPKRTNPEVIVSKVKLMIEVCRSRKLLIADERMKTYTATVATLKHEWNNLFAVLFPILEKLESREKVSPEILNFITESDPDKKTFERLHRSLEKVHETIKSFKDVKDVDFENYTPQSKSMLIKKSA